MSLPVFDSMGIPLNGTQRRAIANFHDLVYQGKIKIREVEKCFCGSDEYRLLSKYDRFGLPFGTRICKSCGLISQTVQIHPDSLSLFYEKIYWPLVIGRSSDQHTEDDFITPPKSDDENSYLLKSIEPSKKHLRVFELGCGSGIRISRIRDQLVERGHEVDACGCDYSSDALQQASRKGIKTIQGGFEELESLGRADILILSHVFEHFPDLHLALQQINNVLASGALVYIEVPGVIDLENKTEYDFNYQIYSVLAHTYNFSLQSLVNVMSQGGFHLVEGDEYVRSVFVKGGSAPQFVSAYKPIMNALERAYDKQKMLEARTNQVVYKYLKSVTKAVLGRATV